MDELLDLKDRLNKQKKKFIKKLFIIENQLLEIEKEFAKLNETQLVESLSLSDQQQKIVDAEDDIILVIACPGAGKTHTLISRYVNLILSKNVLPESVLLITFTKKAGQEMLQRLEDIVPDKLPFHTGSLHGLSYRILQKYNNINYTILNEIESKELLKNEVINYFNNNENVLDYNEIFLIKQEIPKVIEQVLINYPINFKSTLKKYNLTKYHIIIVQIYKNFVKRKKNENVIDFNDLMIMFCDFLKSNKSIEFKEQIKYIFFDEYQDVNPIQNYILQMFKTSKIMCVGDDSQSIYSFRGGSIEYILNFNNNFKNNTIYLLEENYRSSPAIVNFCNNIIDKNINQYKKKVLSVHVDNKLKPFVYAFNNVDTIEQYKWIINDIKDRKEPLTEIAILARNNELLSHIEIELSRERIPFYKQSGISLLNKNHVKDFLAFINIYNNNKSSIHLKRILNLHTQFNIISANDFVETNQELSKVPELYNFLNSLNKRDDKEIDKAKKIVSYLEKLWINNDKNIEEYKQDINILLYYLKNSTLNNFIKELYLNEDVQNDQEGICLSTVHGSKGLEWNNVYIIDVNSNKFPNIRQNYFKDELLDMQEERRLFYVACSRAKHYLVITYHTDSKTDISPFLRELDTTLYQSSDVKIRDIKYKNITDRLKYIGHQNIAEMLLNLNVIVKNIHIEFGSVDKIKNKIIVGTFIDYLIPKIIQNNYKDKLKKFDLKNKIVSQKIHQNYLDENIHWSDLLEEIFTISNCLEKYNTKVCHDFLLSSDTFLFYKELEIGIKKLIDSCKSKNIYTHYNCNFDEFHGEIDILLDDVIIEIKTTSYEAANLTYVCQSLTYGYLMYKKNIKINKIILYNVQSGIINIMDTSKFDFELFCKNLYIF